MSDKSSCMLVRDGNELLLVLSEQIVENLKIKEGDDLIPVDVENGKLTLDLVRTAE
jgi:hypothetical protein